MNDLLKLHAGDFKRLRALKQRTGQLDLLAVRHKPVSSVYFYHNGNPEQKVYAGPCHHLEPICLKSAVYFEIFIANKPSMN